MKMNIASPIDDSQDEMSAQRSNGNRVGEGGFQSREGKEECF